MSDTEPIQARIRERIRDFDVSALIQLLDHLGYERSHILYRSNPSAGPHPSVVHDIEFVTRDGQALVIVTLNIGLLSCRSPLPSYFTELLTHVETADALGEFLRFVDQKLLESRCISYRPERTIVDWQEITHHFLGMTRQRSPSQVHAIFDHIFPELDVSVARGVGEKMINIDPARVGVSILGECVFGGYTKEPAPGLRVTLRAMEPESYANVPWRIEAHRRINRYIVPLLQNTDHYLLVELYFLTQGKYFHLDGESSIGYERLPEGIPRRPPGVIARTPPAGSIEPYRIVIFRGRLSPFTAMPDHGDSAKSKPALPGARNAKSGTS